MIQFRQKNYTIQEGHYTGPKDQEDLPNIISTTVGGAVAGAIVGAAVGKISKDITTTQGATYGAGIGGGAGFLYKFLLNYLHNPMSRVKYQEVDRNIRKEFGIFRAGGVTVGDKVEKRAKLDERFSFNDSNISDYKLNFCIQDNQVTMYTFAMSDKELDTTSNILDYYCKKYYGMEYSSYVINEKYNSYSVIIVFTNHKVISDFILELSDNLRTRVNLLDNKALASEKTFSVKLLNKKDAVDILTKSISKPVPVLGMNYKDSISSFIMNSLTNTIGTLKDKDLVDSGVPMPKCKFDNIYLEQTLRKLRYIEGVNYTVSDETAKNNMSMCSGLFLLTIPKDSKDLKEIDNSFWKDLRAKVKRSDTGKVIVYNYSIQSRNEFELILKKLMSTEITFNIFD